MFLQNAIPATECAWGPWSDWQSCSKNCGGGKKLRNRNMLKEAENGGSCSGSSSQEADCNTQQCRKFWQHLYI